MVKLDAKKASAKVARYQGIAEAAAKQSKRTVIPEIKMPMSFKKAVDYARDINVKFLPYELSEGMSKTKELIRGLKPGESVAIFIGPDGGFEESEVAYAKEAGFEPITLGKRILRTETAGMVVLSWIMMELE